MNRLIILFLIILPPVIKAQNLKGVEPVFQIQTEVKSTPVKDQGKSGTCWAFATISFLESELIRMGKGEYDLSEMFIVRNTYPLKCENYLRLHKHANLSSGGQAHDVLNVIKSNGIVPEEVYKGIQYPSTLHHHEELDDVMKSLSDILFSQKKNNSSMGLKLINNVLDLYLGPLPTQFSYKGKDYSPQTFCTSLDIIPENYIEITSYSCYSFYTFIDLQIPDNWSHSLYLNIPIDEMMEIIDLALKKNYSLCWDGDVSGNDFSSKNGIGLIDFNVHPKITQEIRQITFDQLTTTDDHLMHIIGIAYDQFGNKYYKVKNSWGTNNKYSGYWYLSENYMRLHTVAIMLNKNALPEKINKLLSN